MPGPKRALCPQQGQAGLSDSIRVFPKQGSDKEYVETVPLVFFVYLFKLCF